MTVLYYASAVYTGMIRSLFVERKCCRFVVMAGIDDGWDLDGWFSYLVLVRTFFPISICFSFPFCTQRTNKFDTS